MQTFINGNIYLGLPNSWAKSVRADENGKITEISSSGKDNLSIPTNDEAVIDLQGKFLFPAFEDAHSHPASRCRTLFELDLRETPNWNEAKMHIANYVKNIQSNEWTIVHGWNQTQWGNLTQNDLEIFSEIPIMIINISYHGALLSKAGEEKLRLNGIDEIHHGHIEEETFEKAALLTLPTLEKLKTGITQYLQNLHKLGITSVHDMHIGTIRQLEAYRQLDQEKKLKANILGYVNPYLLDDPQLSPYLDYVGNRFSIAGVKLFLDGAIGLHTAKLSRNYCDKNTSGILRYTTEETLDIVYKAFCHGIRDFALHAIGDHAIDQCIEVAERFKHSHGDKDVRFRVEHAELLTTNAITKMKELNIVPVPQPNFHWDIENYQERLGDFDQLVNPFSNILEAGVLLVFGSDGMPDAPMVGLHYAMNHAKYDCQKISLEQGIEAYTLGGARLAHKEKSRGSISIGKQANFILLDNNPFEHTENLRNIPITQTWIDGEPLL